MCNIEEPKYTETTLEHDDNEPPTTAFDITSYISDSSEIFDCKPDISILPNFSPTALERKPKLGGKRIDMKAQKYVIDDQDQEDDHIDVETVSENGSLPVLEAGDLNSLLEQFEASEEFHTTVQNEIKVKTEKMGVKIKTEPVVADEEENYMPEVVDIKQGSENNIILI